MKHGSLFSGIGGFDLAAQWMRWTNAFHCEKNPFCQTILNYYWPNATSYTDITTTDFTVHRGAIDILTGGFPCQPYSTAGKQLGKDDERHLWPHMLRAIRDIRPRWVVGENVRGLVSWNGGLVFDEVQAELEAEGYEVAPFLLPAAGVDAPHQRYRIWFVAYAKDVGYERGANSNRRDTGQLYPDQSGRDKVDGCESGGCGGATADANGDVYAGKLDAGTNSNTSSGSKSGDQQQTWRDQDGQRFRIESGADSEDAADTCRTGREECNAADITTKSGYRAGLSAPEWLHFPTQSPVCDGNDGISSRLDFAAVFGDVKHPRQPARAFGKWRNASIMGGGNAIVPQVALQIFQAIAQYEGAPAAAEIIRR